MNQIMNHDKHTDVQPAEIVREYGPFSEEGRVHGVAFDGALLWFANGEALCALEPADGTIVQSLAVASDAGTAFDGRYFYQLGGSRIQKVDPKTGMVIATIPAPGNGNDSGLTWAEGTLWVGQYRDRKLYQIDAETGAILRTIESNRFVTGVTWTQGELWHGTWEGDESEIRRIDAASGEVITRLLMPEGTGTSGLESDGGDLLYAGGGGSGKIRAVRRPKSKR